MTDQQSSVRLYVVCGVALALSAVASLQANFASRLAQPSAVAVLNWLDVTQKLDQWKVIQEELDLDQGKLLEKNLGRAQQQKELRDQLEILGKDTQTFRDTLEKLQRMSVLDKAEAELEEGLLRSRRLEEQIKIYIDISEAVAAIAERDGWDVVIWDDSVSKLPNLAEIRGLDEAVELISRRQVFYTNKNTVDITDDVSQFMNNDFNAGG